MDRLLKGVSGPTAQEPMLTRGGVSPSATAEGHTRGRLDADPPAMTARKDGFSENDQVQVESGSPSGPAPDNDRDVTTPVSIPKDESNEVQPARSNLGRAQAPTGSVTRDRAADVMDTPASRWRHGLN